MPSTLCFSRCAAKCPPKGALNDSEQGEIEKTSPVSDIGEGSDYTVMDAPSNDGHNIFTKLWELLCRCHKLWKLPHEDQPLEELSYPYVEKSKKPRIGISHAAHNKLQGHKGTRTGKVQDTDTCLETQRSGMYLDWYRLRAEQQELYSKSLSIRRQRNTKSVCTPLTVLRSQKPALSSKGIEARARQSDAARNLWLSPCLARGDTGISEYLPCHPRKGLHTIDVRQSRTRKVEGEVDRFKHRATDMNSIIAKGKAR